MADPWKALFKKTKKHTYFYNENGQMIKPTKKQQVLFFTQSDRTYKIYYHDITIDDLKKQFEIQKGLSHDLKIPLDLNQVFVSNSPLAPSVDRVDNKYGYMKGNIVLNTVFENKGFGYCSTDQRKLMIDAMMTTYRPELKWIS